MGKLLLWQDLVTASLTGCIVTRLLPVPSGGYGCKQMSDSMFEQGYVEHYCTSQLQEKGTIRLLAQGRWERHNSYCSLCCSWLSTDFRCPCSALTFSAWDACVMLSSLWVANKRSLLISCWTFAEKRLHCYFCSVVFSMNFLSFPVQAALEMWGVKPPGVFCSTAGRWHALVWPGSRTTCSAGHHQAPIPSTSTILYQASQERGLGQSLCPVSSHEDEESLDITTVAQVSATQKRLCNFVLLTSREQQTGTASAQSAVLAAPLLLRAKSDGEEVHPFSWKMGMSLRLL